MKRYYLDGSDPGVWRVFDRVLGSRPGLEVARVFDGEIAMRIVAMLNGGTV